MMFEKYKRCDHHKLTKYCKLADGRGEATGPAGRDAGV